MTQQKTFTLDGQRHRLDPAIPAWIIERHVQRLHVGTPDEAVCEDIRRGVEQSTDAKFWTTRLARQAELYALACHRKNQRLAAHVMKGGR